MHRLLPRSLTALLALALLTGGWPAAAQDRSPAAMSSDATEIWFTIRVAGQPAGWMVERTSVDADGHLVTDNEQLFRLARGKVEIEMRLESRFVETVGGVPVAMETTQDMGGGAVTTRYRFLGDGRVERTTGDGDGQRRETIDAPEGDWLTPGEEDREVERLHRQGAESYRLTTVVPSDGLTPVTVERALVERGTRLGGIDATGDLWTEAASNAPGVISRSLLDPTGEALGSVVRLFGLEVAMERSDRATALGGLEGGRAAPEIMISSLVRPDRPIERPRDLRRAVYDLSLDPEAERSMPALEETSVQRVERAPGDDGDRPRTLRVTVDRSLALPAEPPGPLFLASTPYLAHDDPALVALARRALDSLSDRDGAPSDAETAETLRRFVYRYVSDKSFDHGFATATQVAASRAGDCTEHGVLLAALLRTAGIPSRAVTGVVYVEELQGTEGTEGTFGYHLWTQGYVDGRWLDLDPSFPAPFDATHIAFATSPLAADQTASTAFSGLVTMMGDLEIRVVETK